MINKKNCLLKIISLVQWNRATVRGKRVALSKSAGNIHQWNRSNWRQARSGSRLNQIRQRDKRHVDYCRCPIKDSIERVRRAAFQRSKLGGRGFTRPARKVQLHGDIPRLGAKRPPLYTTNRLERYAARLAPPPLPTPCANDRRERRPICVQDLAVHGELRDGIFIAPFRVSGVG